MDQTTIDRKFKNSYNDEYAALLEAVFGKCSGEQLDDIIGICQLPEAPDEDLGDDTTWSRLPDLVLEKIYLSLSVQERYYASRVCKSWYQAFHLPNVWRTLVFDDRTLTGFDNCSGRQDNLDHLRAQFCLYTIGKHIRSLVFKPINNFASLYQFMNMISFYAERNDSQYSVRNIAAQITALRYTFPCNMSSKNELKIYGTGGQLLDVLKRLIGNLPSLKTLELIDLMLDLNDARQLLDQLCFSHCLLLKQLTLINFSKLPCPLLHAGVFLELTELTICPHNLHDDVIELLSYTNLRHLSIVQNTYTTKSSKPCSSTAWKSCKQRNPHLRVHLRIQSTNDQVLVWQDSAPVCTILLDSPKIKATEETITQAAHRYGQTLQVFGYMRLTRYYQSKSFHDRIDRHLVYLCENCPNLKTLVVREKISTMTILLIAHTAKNLENLHVRKNAVILRRGWPPNLEWSEEVHERIKIASHSYASTEAEMSSILGYKWKMLSDREFQGVSPKTKF